MLVLIVEDELAYSTLLQEELERLGYQVIRAEDGEAGLDLALKQHPDLILLDIRLPKLDGMTVLKQLRKDKYGSTAKVIILTNIEPDGEFVDTLVENAPEFYCVKTKISIDELLEKVAQLLDDTPTQ